MCGNFMPVTLSKKRLRHRCSSVNLAKFLRTPFYRTPPVAAFEIYFERSVLGFVKHLLLKVEVKHWAAMYCS